MTLHGLPALDKLRRRKFLVPEDVEHGHDSGALGSGIISLLLAGTGGATLELLRERLKIGEALYGKEHPSNALIQTLISAYSSCVTKFVEYIVCRKCGTFYRTPEKSKGVWRCADCKSLLVKTRLPESLAHHASYGTDETSVLLPPEIQIAFQSDARLAGKYLLAKEVGRGGTSKVYLGFDLELERVVAIKVIAQGSVPFDWIKAEAQVSARLDFDGIPRVHDAFVWNEGYCIVMDYIDGSNSDRIPISTSKLMSLFLDVAKIMSRAHSCGIVHRDIKPSNILVDRQGTAWITDFGIAKVLTESHIRDTTQSGALVGTPHFMSPEQATGAVSEIDARSDVFSLGATMYFLLTGKHPFSGGSIVEIASSIVSGDADSIKSSCPTIHPDIEAIVFKCLERDRFARYQSMAELAEDIECFMNGEPVSARRMTLLAILSRNIRRRKKELAVAVSFCVAIAACTFAFLRNHEVPVPVQDIRKTLIAKVGKSISEAIELRRRGGSRKEVERLVSQTKNFYETAGIDDAEVHYRLGLFYRAVGNSRDAKTELLKALALEPGNASANYQMGIIRFGEYSERMERLRREWRFRRAARILQTFSDTPASSVPEPAESEIADNAARQMLSACSEKLSNAILTLATGSTERLTAQGIIQRAEGKPAEAERCFREALLADPGNCDAALLICDVLMKSGANGHAAEILGTAIDSDRGNTALLITRSRAFANQGEGAARPEEVDSSYSRAVADLEAAIALDPDNESHVESKIVILVMWADHRIEFGLDPTAKYALALSELDRVVLLSPSSCSVRLKRAGLLLKNALFKENGGENADDDFKRAADDFDAAVRLSCDANSLSWRGGFRLNLAVSHAARRLPAENEFRLAAGDLNAAIALSKAAPDYESFLWRAALYSNWALYRQVCGKNAEAEYSLCVGDYANALELCRAQGVAGICDEYQILVWRGSMWLNRGDHRSLEKDVSEEYFRAREDFECAVKLAPGRSDAYVLLAGLIMNIGVRRMNQGGSPETNFQQSAEYFGKALEMNPRDFRSLMWRGRLFANRAVYLDKRNRDASDYFSLAIRDFDSALKINPNSYECLMWKGEALMNWGDNRLESGSSSFAKYSEALKTLESAAARAPSDFNIWNFIGTCRGAMIVASSAGTDSGFDVRDAYLKLQQSFQKAIDLRPDNGEAFLRRGMYRTIMKDYAAALSDFETGARLSPPLAAQFKSFWDIAKSSHPGDY